MSAALRQAVQQEVERLRTSLEERIVGLAETIVQETVEEARRQLEATEERLATLERANGQAVLGRKLAEARLEEEVKRRTAIEKQLAAARQELSRAKSATASPASSRVEPSSRAQTRPAAARETATTVVAPPQFAASRQTERVKLQSANDVLVDGVTSILVDISIRGAQVLSPTTLRPNRVVRLMLRTSTGTCAGEGRIVWAHLESSSAAVGAQYRAGMLFTNMDRAAITALVGRQ